MTHAVKTRALRRSFRAVGLTALIAGGWCCWLAFSQVPDAAEPEAIHDWNESQPTEAVAAKEITQPPRRLAAELTDVTPVAAVGSADDDEAVILAELEQLADEKPTIEPVRHVPEAEVPAAASQASNGIWLTGAIEDDETAETRAENRRTRKRADRRKKEPR